MQDEKDIKINDEDVKDALSRVIKSPGFKKAYRLRQLLEHLVNRQLEGKEEDLKGYSIGVDVFDKGADFNPDSDTIVRVQMVRLRRMLEHYYLTDGKGDRLMIDVPKGRYIPSYSLQAILEDDEDEAEKTEDGKDDDLGELALELVEKTGWRFKEFLYDDPMFLILIIGLTSFMTYLLFAPGKEAVVIPNAPSIALFPFTNNTGRQAHKPFELGIPVHITHGLKRFNDLKIIAPDTTLHAEKKKEKYVDVAGEKNAKYMIYGGFGVGPNILGVSVILKRVKTEEVVWSKDYERNIVGKDLHEVQNEISDSVVTELAQPYGIINREETALIRGRDPRTYNAYECVLLFLDSSPVYNEAVHLDVRNCLERTSKSGAGNARAFAALAWNYVDEFRLLFNQKGPNEPPALDRALFSARKAVAIDPSDAFNHRYMSVVHVARGEYYDALKSIRRAVELNPTDASVVADLGWNLKANGKWDEAYREANRAISMNPGHRSWYLETPILYYYHTRNCRETNNAVNSYRRHSSKAAIVEIFAIISGVLCKKTDLTEYVQALNSKYPRFLSQPRKLLRNYGIPNDTLQRILTDLKTAGVAVDG